MDRFLPRELSVLVSIQHPCVIQVLEVIQTVHVVCIITEYAEKGDLLVYIRERRYLDEIEAASMFKQICLAMSYLHDHHICHRDLKCENILIRMDGSVAIADFGFSKFVDPLDIMSNTHCGSTAYASPELLRGKSYNPFLNDVWGLGCVLYVMVTGRVPFNDTVTKKQLVTRQMSGSVTFPTQRPFVSQACREVIRNALDPNTERRCTVKQLLELPWVSQEQSKLKAYARRISSMQSLFSWKERAGSSVDSERDGRSLFTSTESDQIRNLTVNCLNDKNYMKGEDSRDGADVIIGGKCPGGVCKSYDVCKEDGKNCEINVSCCSDYCSFSKFEDLKESKTFYSCSVGFKTYTKTVSCGERDVNNRLVESSGERKDVKYLNDKVDDDIVETDKGDVKNDADQNAMSDSTGEYLTCSDTMELNCIASSYMMAPDFPSGYLVHGKPATIISKDRNASDEDFDDDNKQGIDKNRAYKKTLSGTRLSCSKEDDISGIEKKCNEDVTEGCIQKPLSRVTGENDIVSKAISHSNLKNVSLPCTSSYTCIQNRTDTSNENIISSPGTSNIVSSVSHTPIDIATYTNRDVSTLFNSKESSSQMQGIRSINFENMIFKNKSGETSINNITKRTCNNVVGICPTNNGISTSTSIPVDASKIKTKSSGSKQPSENTSNPLLRQVLKRCVYVDHHCGSNHTFKDPGMSGVSISEHSSPSSLSSTNSPSRPKHQSECETNRGKPNNIKQGGVGNQEISSASTSGDDFGQMLVEEGSCYVRSESLVSQRRRFFESKHTDTNTSNSPI